MRKNYKKFYIKITVNKKMHLYLVDLYKSKALILNHNIKKKIIKTFKKNFKIIINKIIKFRIIFIYN